MTKTVESMLADLRDRWSVSLVDVAEGWQLRLSTVNEHSDIDEHTWHGESLATVVHAAWAGKPEGKVKP